MANSFTLLAQGFNQWLIKRAIPLSANNGICRLNHASFEQFLNTGQVDSATPIRVRVQARQIYVFACAAANQWFEEGQEIAVNMMTFTEQKAHHPEWPSGFSHIFDSNFNVIDNQFDLYNHAFFFLAYAGLYQLNKDPGYSTKAENLYQLLETHFKSEFGGWLEGDYQAKCRRQNPHMHLFESFMLWYQVSDNSIWLERAKAIFELFTAHFYDEKNGVLLEFFEDNWAPHHSKRGAVIEPGHMLEWVWLLDWYSELSGENVDRYLEPLFSNALTLGMSSSGLLYKEISLYGEMVDAKKRCWAMTELVKACLVMVKRGNQAYLEMAEKGLGDLMFFYTSAKVDGLYVDEIDEYDQISIDKAPASSLYHFVTLAEVLDEYLRTSNNFELRGNFK